MAYTTIPNTTSIRTPSPVLPELSHTPLSTTFEHVANNLFTDQSTLPSKLSVSGVLRSLTSSQHSSNSYELVEEDDYEQAQVTPKVPKRMSKMMEQDKPEESDHAIPVRTASISRNLPLHNPTPDLQSLQGAYLKNVERLEDSAARLSLAGSIEEELQRINLNSRRKDSSHSRDSASSALKRQLSGQSNSIINVNLEARSGGYSPAGYVKSPVGSITSRKRSMQREVRNSKHSHFSSSLPEPEYEGRPLESAMVHSPPSHVVQPRHSSDSQRSASVHSSVHDRPGTSASNDTYQQAQHLFTDFDGTHFSYHDDSISRRISLKHPPLARDSKAFKEPQPGEKMIYYPAPVPVMLNLPKRLSRGDWAVTEKRRSQALSHIPAEMRKSAAWLANVDSEAELDSDANNRRSNIPSQLRASAFFDSPGVRTDVKLKDGSAVMTLDSILDAAAHAPVSAFTDHPIVGHLGNEVYGPETNHKRKSSETERRRKSSLNNILSRRKSSDNLSRPRRLSQVLDNEVDLADDDPEKNADKSIAPGEDEMVDDDKEESNEGEEEEEQHQLGFLGAPTTLLAELQMRKAQQKMRNKTAADAFPDGMHSTLLELDAVAQLQQKSRKMKHVALAWEDQEAVEKTNFDDEDIPLAILFPEKNQSNLANMHRPIGLLERRELEENEPLGQRRARLRGEIYQLRGHCPKPEQAVEDPAPMLKVDGIDEDDEEIEGETLAQRIRRMKEKKDNKRPSLADDIASQLGLDPEQLGGSKTPEADEEETLGQRRKRLQAEAEKARAGGSEALKRKISMGDLLRSNPVGPRFDERQAQAESKVSLLMNRREPGVSLVDHIQAAQPGSKAINSSAFDNNPPPYFPNQPLLGHRMQVGQQQQAQHHQSQPQGLSQMNGFMYNNARMPQLPLFQQMHMAMPGVQPMPYMNATQTNGGYFQQALHPYGNQLTNMSGMSLGVNNMMNTSMNNSRMHMQFMPGYGAAPAYDAIEMGPPLNSQQRATIDQWRQGIA